VKKVMALLVVLVLAIASIGCSRLFTITQTKYDISGTFIVDGDGDVDFDLIKVGVKTIPDTNLTLGADHGFAEPDSDGNWSKTGVWGSAVEVTPAASRPGFIFTPESVILSAEDNEAEIMVKDTYYLVGGTFTTEDDEEEIDFSQIPLRFSPTTFGDITYANADGTWDMGFWGDDLVEVTVEPQSIQVGDFITYYEPSQAIVSKDNPIADFEVFLIYAESYTAKIKVMWGDRPLYNVYVHVGEEYGEDLSDRYGDDFKGVIYTDGNGEAVIPDLLVPLYAQVVTPGIVGDTVRIEHDNPEATISVDV
jgi:hypothetical protein